MFYRHRFGGLFIFIYRRGDSELSVVENISRSAPFFDYRGGKVRVGFEGGQMPLVRRIPKRGFNNIFAKPLTAVNVNLLNCFEDGAVVDAAAIVEAGIVSTCPNGLKVLGSGELTKKLTVKAAAFSESAKEKIEQAGGKAEVI